MKNRAKFSFDRGSVILSFDLDMFAEEVRTAWSDNTVNRDGSGLNSRRAALRQPAVHMRTAARSGVVPPTGLQGGDISFRSGIQLPDAESALQEIMPLKQHARAGLISDRQANPAHLLIPTATARQRKRRRTDCASPSSPPRCGGTSAGRFQSLQGEARLASRAAARSR